jgi:hypothetical protein
LISGIIVIVLLLVGIIIYASQSANFKKSPARGGGLMKILYAIILGVMLAFFVGLGVEAFYPTENRPEVPAEIQYGEYNKTGPTDEQKQAQKDYDQQIKAYQTRNEKHALNVSIIVIIASILYMALSLTILTKTNTIFSDGFLIGSLLTLLYGIVRGFETNDNKFRFVIVTIGLIIALVLGYIKFVRQKETEREK